MSKTDVKITLSKKMLVQAARVIVIIKTVAVDSQPFRQKLINPDFIILFKVVNICLRKNIAAGIFIPDYSSVFQTHHPFFQGIYNFFVMSG